MKVQITQRFQLADSKAFCDLFIELAFNLFTVKRTLDNEKGECLGTGRGLAGSWREAIPLLIVILINIKSTFINYTASHGISLINQ